MRRRQFLGLTIGMLSFKSDVVAAERSLIHWQSDVNEAWRVAQESGRPLLLYVSMANCGYCRKMEQQTLSHPEIARQIDDSYVAARINSQTHAQLVRRLQVEVFPTTVIISPENRVLAVVRGYASPQQLQPKLASITGNPHVARRPSR